MPERRSPACRALAEVNRARGEMGMTKGTKDLPKVCVVSYESRADLRLANQLREASAGICAQDPRCECVWEVGTSHISPYWGKVALARDVLKRGDCDLLVALDSDAVLNKPVQALRDIAQQHPDAALVATYEQPMWGTAKVNSGVFLANRSAGGQDVLDEWMRRYEESGSKRWWRNADGKWRTDCAWASAPCYEQGSLLDMIVESSSAKRIERIHSDELNSQCDTEKRVKKAAACHFAVASPKKQAAADAWLRRWGGAQLAATEERE